MSDTSHSSDDASALRAAIDALAARLDRVEGQAAQPSAHDSVQSRLSGAWDALRGGGAAKPAGTAPTATPGGLLRPALAVCAVLLVVILAVELTEEIFDGLGHFGRWID